jgi:fucose permease
MGVAHQEPRGTTASQRDSGFGEVMKHKLLHILVAFVFVYVGTEVTVGGWIVTFLIGERGGGAEAGYVSSGFFAGTFCVIWPTKLCLNQLCRFGLWPCCPVMGEP